MITLCHCIRTLLKMGLNMIVKKWVMDDKRLGRWLDMRLVSLCHPGFCGHTRDQKALYWHLARQVSDQLHMIVRADHLHTTTFARDELDLHTDWRNDRNDRSRPHSFNAATGFVARSRRIGLRNCNFSWYMMEAVSFYTMYLIERLFSVTQV